MHKMFVTDILDIFMFKLINDTKQRERFEAFMEKAEIAELADRIEKFDAIIYKNENDIPKDFKSKFIDRHLITPAEFGCYASHLEICRQFLKSEKQLLVIFEDDAVILPHAALHLSEIAIWLFKKHKSRKDILAIHLGVIPTVGRSFRLYTPHNTIIRMLHPPLGTEALLLTREGAHRWLSLKKKTIADLDLWCRPHHTGIWPHGLKIPVAGLHPKTHLKSTIKEDGKELPKRQFIRKKPSWAWNLELLKYAWSAIGPAETLRMATIPLWIFWNKHMMRRKIDVI